MREGGGYCPRRLPVGRSQLNINCSPELLQRLKQRAQVEGETLTALVVRLLESQLNERRSGVPLAERLEAIEARLQQLEAQT